VQPSATSTVFAVQCPNPKCRKYMLVEAHDRGKVVSCLICKAAIRVAAAGGRGSGQKSETRNPKSETNSKSEIANG
jgi:hypothetical protein